MIEWKMIWISFSPPLAHAHSFIERSSFIWHAFLTILWSFTVVSALLVRFITYTCFLIKAPGHSSSVLWVFAIAIAAMFCWWGTGLAEVCYQHKHIRHILSRSCHCRFSRFQLYGVLSAVPPWICCKMWGKVFLIFGENLVKQDLRCLVCWSG